MAFQTRKNFVYDVEERWDPRSDTGQNNFKNLCLSKKTPKNSRLDFMGIHVYEEKEYQIYKVCRGHGYTLQIRGVFKIGGKQTFLY